MPSWYLAAFLKYYGLSGKSTATVNNIVSIPVKYDITALSFGLSLGKRWVLPFGFCVGARIGYGPSSVTVDYTGSTPDDKKFIESLLGIVLGLDAELTLGWAF
jgi:hypothetical protein